MTKTENAQTDYAVTLLGRRGYIRKTISAPNEETARKKAAQLYPFGWIIEVKPNAQ